MIGNPNPIINPIYGIIIIVLHAICFLSLFIFNKRMNKFGKYALTPLRHTYNTGVEMSNTGAEMDNDGVETTIT